MAAQSMSKQVAFQLAENKQFFLQQKHFEEGEFTGHILAMLIRTQQVSSYISAIQDAQGLVHCSSADVLHVFCTFYVDLYSAKVHATKAEIAAF